MLLSFIDCPTREESDHCEAMLLCGVESMRGQWAQDQATCTHCLGLAQEWEWNILTLNLSSWTQREEVN